MRRHPRAIFPPLFADRVSQLPESRQISLKTAGPRFQTDQIKTFPGSFSRANFSHIPSLTFFSVNKLVFCEEFIKVSLERKHHIFLLAAAAVIGVVMEAFYMQRRSGPSHAHMSHVSLAGLVAAEMGKACLGNEATGLRRDTWHSSLVSSSHGGHVHIMSTKCSGFRTSSPMAINSIKSMQP